MAEKKFTEEEMEILRDAFDAIDENENGFIERSELKSLLKEVADSLGERFNAEEAEKEFTKADTDNNNKIDFNEFVSNLSDYVI